jgi:hypothetical protein
MARATVAIAGTNHRPTPRGSGRRGLKQEATQKTQMMQMHANGSAPLEARQRP